MAVKNVTFEVSADTTKAQQSLAKLIEQLDKIKESSKLSITAGVTNLDKEIQTLSNKLDQVAKDNARRKDNEVKKVTDTENQKTKAVSNALDEQKKAYETFAKYNADILKKEIAAFNEAEKKKQQLAKESQAAFNKSTRDAKAAEKTQKVEDFNKSPFGQLSQQAQAAAEKARQLGAQLILLEQAGKKNTVEYNALAKEFKKVSADALKTSEALNKLKFSSNLPGARQSLTGLAGAVNFISQSVANSSTNFVRLRNIIARTGVALGAVSIGASILSFGRAAVDAAKNYETLSVSFGTLIGNATLAQQKIRELRVFAAETPFTVDDVFQASRTLLGYGVTVGELIPTIKTLGDVAGGVGVPLERLALVFGQVRAAGRLYGQDLLQLVTAGFNPLSEISRTTGESFDSLKDKMRKGLITFEDVQNAFKTATSEGGKFFGLTNALANTTTGQLARLSEEYNELLRQIGEGLLPVYNNLINVGRASLEFFRELPNTIKENAFVFTLLTTATTALTAAYFANSLNIVKNTAATALNTVGKVINRIATAALAGANVIATQGITRQTIATAALTTGTRLATSAMNAFKAALSTNALGLIITVLSTAAAAWYAFSDAVDTANDGFIDSKEAFNEFDVAAKKAIGEETAATKKLFDVARDGNKSLRERQKALDEVNEKYETSIKLVGDEKKDIAEIEKGWLNVEQAIIAVNNEIVSGEIIKKLRNQIADVQLELLNLADKAGVEIPLSLITSDKEIQSGFKETRAIIESELDSLNEAQPSLLKVFGSLTNQSIPIIGTLKGIGQAISFVGTEKQINGVELLNVQLDKLVSSQGTLGAFIKLLTDGAGGDVGGGGDDTEAEKERLRRLKEFESEYASLLDRIRKNNEELRKQRIEFSFIDAADFEEEIEKLKLLDKVSEDTVNREIDREIESVKRRDITESQKTQLIGQLEVIRFQEQEKRANDLQQRLYEIERDGVRERRKLALELGEIYDQVISDRLQKEVDSLDNLRDQIDEFYNDIFEDNPFAKGRFITAPRIEFGGTEFQFEDARAELDALAEDIAKVQRTSSGGIVLSQSTDLVAKSIDDFNKKYKTSIQLTTDQTEQTEQLTQAYEDLRKTAAQAQSEQKKLTIFQFARGVQERGLEDPFVTAIEESQRTYLSKLSEQEQAEKTRLTNKRNTDVQLLEGDADRALKTTIIDAQLQKDIQDLEDETSTKRDERLKKDTKSLEENSDAQLAVIQEERDARIQAFQDIALAFLDFQKAFIDGQVQQTEAAISAQEKRVDAAKEIADKGNADLLKLEQERLDKLNRQRASFVRQQQALAAVEIAVNSAIAISKAAGQPGSPFTIFAILAAMAVGFAQARAQAQSAATFAKGGYTGDGHQFQEAGTVHKGEFVINAQRTRQYRPLLEAIHAGRKPQLATTLNERAVVVNNKSTDERLERIEKAIIGQKGLQLSIDENGINGIVSRITYKQQRINNRTK